MFNKSKSDNGYVKSYVTSETIGALSFEVLVGNGHRGQLEGGKEGIRG